MRLASLFIILGFISCRNEDFSINNSRWINESAKTSLTIDSGLNATISFKHLKGERKYLLEVATEDSFIYSSIYKDSIVCGGYLKLISSTDAIFCNYKSPNSSGKVDGFTYFRKEGSSKIQQNLTKVTFPRKLGRYLLEFTDESINNTNSQDRLYKFKTKQLKVESKLYPLEITTNNYEFYFDSSNIRIPEFDKSIKNDSIAQINPDSIFVWRLGMNTVSHYKIYQYDSLRVNKDAEYFFVGKLNKIMNHEIFDQY
jgi:hypothetical protein